MRFPILFLTAALVLPAQERFSASADIDAQVEKAIRDGLIPGAVVLIGKDDQILHRKAYGSRILTPTKEPMTIDTIFDAASLTKVIACTSAVMKLVEEGKLRIGDKVTDYLPGFQNGKSDITIRQLLTHFSGLRPDLDLRPVWTGYETGVQKALIDKPTHGPGERFVYSDINFILLGEIVRVLSGDKLDQFTAKRVFGPLKMNETMFNPPASLRPRTAATEIDELTGQVLRGTVHDETTRFMGGVSGHAGLFTTANDLSRFARMMLHEGELEGTRVFSPLTIRKFTYPNTPPTQGILRGLGWDMDSPYSGNRGDLYPLGSFGHTGFTGTSLWIDPSTRSYVIVLTNSVHPKRGKNITGLRGRIATIAAAAMGIQAPKAIYAGYNETMGGVRRASSRNGKVETGLDVLAAEKFASLKGKRVGLITNHTGLSSEGKRNVDLMMAAGVEVTKLFSPEHGIAGALDHEKIGDTKDAATGVPVFSLYQGERRRPTQEMLDNLDAVVFDIQDVGARFYTYSCTMLYSMEEAAKHKVPFWVLDRPNPITGTKVEGPPMDDDLHSFIGCFNMPLRHGLTFAELAQMANAERKFGADLHVVKSRGWERGDWFDSTGLTWVDPSPNMRSLNAAVLYPGIAMLEASRNYSVGRGTDAPFEQIGADFIKGKQLAAALNARLVPGIRVYPTRFRPTSSNFKDQWIEGVRFVITDREAFHSTRFGLELAFALANLYPGKIDWERNAKLIGHRATLQAISQGQDPRTTIDQWQDAIRAFEERRKPYLLY